MCIYLMISSMIAVLDMVKESVHYGLVLDWDTAIELYL